MAHERGGHRLALRIPAGGGALDVGEQEGQDAGAGLGHLSDSQEGRVDKLMRHGTTTSALVTPRQAYAGDPAVVGTIAVGCDRGAGDPRNRPSTLRSSSTSGQ